MRARYGLTQSLSAAVHLVQSLHHVTDLFRNISWRQNPLHDCGLDAKTADWQRASACLQDSPEVYGMKNNLACAMMNMIRLRREQAVKERGGGVQRFFSFFFFFSFLLLLFCFFLFCFLGTCMCVFSLSAQCFVPVKVSCSVVQRPCDSKRAR